MLRAALSSLLFSLGLLFSACGGTQETNEFVVQQPTETPPEVPGLLSYTPAPEGHEISAVAIAADGSTLVVFVEQSAPLPQSVVQDQSGRAQGQIALPRAARISVGDDKIAIGEGRNVAALGPDSSALFASELPEDAAVSAVATGYANVVFAMDGTQGKIFTVTSAEASQLHQDSALVGATSMIRVGGQLIVGGPNGLCSVSLREPECVAVGTNVPAVLDLVRDDLGNYLVATTDGSVWRVSPTGEAQQTSVSGRYLAFDADNRLLIAATSDGTYTWDYRVVTGRQLEEDPAGTAGPFSLNGVTLTGAEYWPNRGDSEPDYPADILWGFYPREGQMFDGEVMSASATPEAIACMEESHAALRSWIDNNAARIRAVADSDPSRYSARFYLWVNDYSTASDPFPHDVRPARLWYWQRDPAVVGRIPGYWKWETSVLQDGSCQFPSTEQAVGQTVELALGCPTCSDAWANSDVFAARVARLVRSQTTPILACYNQALRSDASTLGRISIRFTIEESGRVSQANATQNTTGSPSLAACVSRVIAGLRWEEGPDDGPVTFQYPFIFAPEN